jgi:PAS domain S-box-containing protein
VSRHGDTLRAGGTRAPAAPFPAGLYGREAALAALAAARERAGAEHTFGISVLRGPSGIGKSALLARFLADVPPGGSTVVAVRADPYGGAAPYAALAAGWRRLVSGILAAGGAELAYWRARVAGAACDPESMLALVPELAPLLEGAAPAPAATTTTKATTAADAGGSGRVAAAMLCLVRAFATPKRPLVLAVDNAQWLDGAALRLLEQLAGMAAGLPAMLVIVTRTEAGSDGAGALAARLAARAAYFQDIALEGLAPAALAQLLADMFVPAAASASAIAPLDVLATLAALIHGKTAGHPYFARQFIEDILDDGLARKVDGAWQFSLAQIDARGATGDMAALALRRLACLPAAMLPLLGTIAGLGQPADAALLCELAGIDGAGLAALLAPALAADILVADGGAHVFRHDCLQEAAYGMLDADARRRLHHGLAGLLGRQALRDGRDDTLFRAADHLARTPGPLAAEEAQACAELAAHAGQRARLACAYDAAAAYLGQATQLLSALPQSAPRRFELECELAGCHFLAGQLEACAALLDKLLAAPAERLARGRLQSLAVALAVRRGRYRAAVGIALAGLRAFGIDIAEEPSDAACDQAYAALRPALVEGAEGAGDALQALAPLDDAEVAVALKLLSSLLAPSSFVSQRLFFLQLCHTLQLTLRHGMTAESAVALAWLGVMVCERYRAFAEGFAYGQAALGLVRHAYAAHEARVLLALDQLSVWTQPLAFALDCAQAGFEAARAQGDGTIACFEACHRTCLLLTRGDNLETVGDEVAQALAFVRQVGFGDVETILLTQQAFVDRLRTVRGAQGGRAALVADAGADDAGDGAVEPMTTLRFWRWLYIAILDYLEGEVDAALASLDRAGRLAWSAPGHVHQLEFHLFSVLALCRQAGAAPQADGQDPERRRRILRHVGQIEAWAASNPATFADKLALAQAALHELDGDALAALDACERAAAHAGRHGAEHIAGIAHEHAAALSARRGLATAARAHAHTACQAYRRWGALNLVARLEAAYPPAAQDGVSGLGPPAATAAIRDIDSVIRSVRALSEEIHAAPLVRTLMTITLRHADARRGLLIRCEGDAFLIQAEARTRDGGVEVDMRQTAPAAHDLPLTMLHLAQRSGLPLGVSDSQRPPPLGQDPYLASYPRCAAVVIPLLKRGRPVGMLYLENRLSAHGFTGEQVQVLSLLAAQAAVSLETAQLYAELLEENRGRRRVEQALRESRATLLLGESINRSGSWTWEVERGLVNCSAEFCRIFDLDPDTPRIGFGALMEHVHQNDRAQVMRVLGDAIAGRRPVRLEHRIVDGEGVTRYLSVVGQPMGAGDADMYVGTVSDVTRRKIDEEALRKARAELAHGARMATVSQLTAAIAHEVNQPLMAISANAGAGLRWLRRDPPRADQVGGLLQEIVGQSQRAGKIIQALQALGQRSPQFGAVDLHALIRATLALARADLDRHEVGLELALRAPHSRIEGDAVQLQQVLVNLVENAIEAMAPVQGQARQLRIATAKAAGSAGWIEVRVEDNGRGAGAPGLEAMFEPFATGKPDGMGMGLAVCRSIIEAHGGAIHAQARAPQGCSLVFSLPGGAP